MIDFDTVIKTKDVYRVVAGDVRVYHVGNLARDRGEGRHKIREIDRKAAVAVHQCKLGKVALFQRRLGPDTFEYIIMGTGMIPALHGWSGETPASMTRAEG